MKSVIWYKRLSFQIFALLFMTLWLVFGIVLVMNTSAKKLLSMLTSKFKKPLIMPFRAWQRVQVRRVSQ